MEDNDDGDVDVDVEDVDGDDGDEDEDVGWAKSGRGGQLVANKSSGGTSSQNQSSLFLSLSGSNPLNWSTMSMRTMMVTMRRPTMRMKRAKIGTGKGIPF